MTSSIHVASRPCGNCCDEAERTARARDVPNVSPHRPLMHKRDGIAAKRPGANRMRRAERRHLTRLQRDARKRDLALEESGRRVGGGFAERGNLVPAACRTVRPNSCASTSSRSASTARVQCPDSDRALFGVNDRVGGPSKPAGASGTSTASYSPCARWPCSPRTAIGSPNVSRI